MYCDFIIITTPAIRGSDEEGNRGKNEQRRGNDTTTMHDDDNNHAGLTINIDSISHAIFKDDKSHQPINRDDLLLLLYVLWFYYYYYHSGRMQW